MKHYLDLVPVMAGAHRKQSRMSVLCIVLSVFLVTAIFSMADMFIRSQILQAQKEGGCIHIGIRDITDEEGKLIAGRPQVRAAARYGVLNYRGDQGYTLSGKTAVFVGCDEAWTEEFLIDYVSEGHFPQLDTEALVTENAKEQMGLKLGDLVAARGPGGEMFSYRVSGFCRDAIKTMREDSYGIILTTDAFRQLYPGEKSNELSDYNSVLYVRFKNPWKARQEIRELKEDFDFQEKQIFENTKLLGMYGQSSSSFMLHIYLAAAVLFVLVLLAGIMMIAGSLNNYVARRIQFFGLLRCIGASRGQVMKIVEKEAAGWCLGAVPAGILLGAAVTCILCGILRMLSPEYFSEMPVLSLSALGVGAGCLEGWLTVWLAARLPAKRAAKASPLAAASGNAAPFCQAGRRVPGWLKVDTALGIRHAGAYRGNLILTAGSFALSIILFLSFSVTVELMEHTLTPLRPWTPDLSIISAEGSNLVDAGLLKALKENPAVKTAYGRIAVYDVPVMAGGGEIRTDLISYDRQQFDWAENYLLEGDAKGVLAVYNQEPAVQAADEVILDPGGLSLKLKVAGVLSVSPFHSDKDTGLLICPEPVLRSLAGDTGYAVIDIQLEKSADDEDVEGIRQLAGDSFTFSDRRMGNRSTIGAYYSFWLFIYGFLVLVALITVFHIVNSISMSVSARAGEYGIFRALGLSKGQLFKMVLSEACTYALLGGITGTGAGLWCSRMLYGLLITSQWGDAWRIPFLELSIISGVLLLSVWLAVIHPVRELLKTPLPTLLKM